jgi:KDO2-lipid IV(A) lauroyltransferase
MEHMTVEKYIQRVELDNEELLHEIISRNKGVVVVMSHTGNWEWICQRIAIASHVFDETDVIAKEMSNPYFEKYFRFLRLRIQSRKIIMVPFLQSAKYVSSARHSMNMIVTIADQTPHKNQINFRTQFLNQDTPVFLGPEKIGRALDYEVVFCHTKRTKRGKYKIHLEPISIKPKTENEFQITLKHLKMLENDIHLQPESWLWSHRRWKY